MAYSPNGVDIGYHWGGPTNVGSTQYVSPGGFGGAGIQAVNTGFQPMPQPYQGPTYTNSAAPESWNQIAASTFVQINNYWTVYGAYAYDLVRQESRIGRIGAVYRDECFAILFSLDETFHADRDIAQGVSFLVRFGFKYLGDFGG